MFPPKNATLDKNRCVVSQNQVVQEFNAQLKDRVVKLRNQFKDAAITYVDAYSAKYALIDNAQNEGNNSNLLKPIIELVLIYLSNHNLCFLTGFDDPWNFCCGSLTPIPTFCGTQMELNNTVYYGASCADPWKHISWDGMHFTDAANAWLSKKIVVGFASDPPVPIDQACP